MATTRSDMYILSQEATFQNRVRAAMLVAAISITTEADSVTWHRERQTYAVSVINAPDTFKMLFANTVATDASVAGAATQAGTVALTTGNVPTQQALASDAQIDAAISGQFNSFFRRPAS